MKMRLESLVHAARQRYGAWAAIFILFAALCTLSVFSARDAREAAADPAKAESDSSVYYSPNDAASQETDRESAANSANFKEYETFFTVRAYNGSVAVFKDGKVLKPRLATLRRKTAACSPAAFVPKRSRKPAS